MVARTASDPGGGVTPYDRMAFSADEVTRWLARGEHPQLLQTLFGPEAHAELVPLAIAAEAAAARQRRSRRRTPPARVWILPGIMGSQLGLPRGAGQPPDILWLDALDIILGRLVRLRTDTAPPAVSMGVLLPSYLRLSLRLTAAGFAPKFFDYDWRRDLRDLGRDFATALRADGRATHIVAHSMGGLVARAALTHGTLPAIERVLLLGTPNFGSYAAVQALRGSYAVVRKLALLDLRHDAEELASGVFSTFPSLYHLLPFGRAAEGVDFHQQASWPAAGPRPEPARLRAAQHLEQALAPADSRFIVIAGIGERTVHGAQLDASRDQFSYAISRLGDGTVPLVSAELPGAPRYLTQVAHSDLPRSAAIAEAVIDMLNSGTTTRLGTELPTTQRWHAHVTDDELRAATRGKIDWHEMTPEQRRHFLERLNDMGDAPLHRDDTRGTARKPEATAPRAAPKVAIVTGDIAEGETSAIAAGILQDVRPAGAVAALDARLGGVIAEFRWRRMLSGETGRVAYVPARERLGGTQAVLLAGLGPFDRLAPSAIEFAAENVARMCRRAGFASLSTVIWGAGAGLPPREAFEAQLRGLLRGPAPSQIVFRVRDVATRDLLRTAAAHLLADFTGQDSVIEEIPQTVEPERGPRVVPLRATARTAYLLVNCEAVRDDAETWRLALLTAGSPAAIIAESQPVSRRALMKLLGRLEAERFGLAELKRFGTDLAELVLHPKLRELLGRMKDTELIVVHDAATSRVPWETLAFGSRSPAIDSGMSRRYAAGDLSLARFSEQRREQRELAVLLIGNPTGDLPGAELERERVERLLRGRAGIRLEVIAGRAASRARVLGEFQSGRFDVVHYAGHAFFDAATPGRSGLVCSDGDLTGQDLESLARLPSLVVANACESGRVRRGATRTRRGSGERATEALAGRVGLAESLLRGGIANFIGTYWPVGDSAALAFAEVFYARLLANDPLGAAVLAARRRVRDLRSPDWADYIHYGDPDFRLKLDADRNLP